MAEGNDRVLAGEVIEVLEKVSFKLPNASPITNCLPDRGERNYLPREQLPLPTKPPFTVHLGNMSFDASEGDIHSLFAGCEVTSVRIVEDKLDRKPKGFGYAEFATLDGLKKALDLNGTQFQGRNIRISVAEPRKLDIVNSMTANAIVEKERSDTRDFDWNARRGPLPPAEPAREIGRGSFRGNRPDFGGEGGDRPRRPAYEAADGKERDFSNWERKGPLSPAPPSSTPGSGRLSNAGDGPRERKNSPAWGEGRSNEGSRPPRREYGERPVPERAPTAAELDTQWRSKMRPDPPAVTSPTTSNKDTSTTNTPPAGPPTPVSSTAPTTRPKLNLQKRTVSQAEHSPALPTGNSDTKASPFGAARPIDTTQREKQIEEKLQQRKEQEEKAREERRLAEDKAKDTKRNAKEQDRSDKGKPKANGQAKESDNQDTASRNYQILRREAGENESEAGDHEPTGDVISPETEKNVKPQEVVRDTNGEADTSAQQLEEEGWSTVSKPVKSRKGPNNPRAIAS